MPYAFLLYLVMLPNTWFTFYFINIAVPSDHPLRYPFWGTALVTGIWFLNNYLLPAPSVLLQLLSYLLSFLLLCFLTEKGRKGLAIFTQTMLFAADVFLTFILLALLSPLLVHWNCTIPQLLAGNSTRRLLITGLYTLLSCPFLYGIARLLKTVLTPVTETKRLLWFLPLPFVQLILGNLSVRFAFGMESGWNHIIVAAMCLTICLGADGICILLFLQLKKLQQMRFLVNQAEEQLKIQTEHYRSLYASISQVNQIRHDLNNQLGAAYQLLSQDRQDLVKGQLDVLQASIQNRIGCRHCSNLMVDAVLTEKETVCQEKGLKLDISCMIPQELPLENAHLCSAFSNLLDNAIAGALASGCRNRPIVIHSDIQKEHLVIRCSNPAVLPKKKHSRDPLRVHGVGIEILKRLADMYQGDLQLDYHDNLFQAVLLLHLPPVP